MKTNARTSEGALSRTRATLLLLPLLVTLLFAVPTSAANKVQVRRERGLDHWDADTLAYHLDNNHQPAAGYDVVILMYAPWDRNSHALAQGYAKIAEILKAGTSQSNLIMALFDCEADASHAELCKAASVSHYPTLMFLGSGPLHDTDWFTRFLYFGNKNKSAGIMGACPVRNGAKFQGNWQYTESVLDWIKTLQFLSRWHNWMTLGWGRKLRLLKMGRHGDTQQNKNLPVGIPKGGSILHGASETAAGKEAGSLGKTAGGAAAKGPAATSAADKAKIDTLETTVSLLTNHTQRLERNVERSGLMLDSIFQPEDSRDIYSTLNETDAWSKFSSTSEKDGDVRVLMSCALEIGLDYCQRVAKHAATRVVDKATKDGALQSTSMEDLEAQVKAGINDAEPYCLLLETCIVNDMADEKCRPAKCPFEQSTACRYLNTCFEDSVQEEYRTAMGLTKPAPAAAAVGAGAGAESGKTETQSTTETSTGDAKKKAKWGLGL